VVDVEVEMDKEPAEGEVLVFTTGGGFVVKGSVADVTRRLAAKEWAHFELAESEDTVNVRSSQVVALPGGRKPRRGPIGFTPH